jgi:hypothetical protein
VFALRLLTEGRDNLNGARRFAPFATHRRASSNFRRASSNFRRASSNFRRAYAKYTYDTYGINTYYHSLKYNLHEQQS